MLDFTSYEDLPESARDTLSRYVDYNIQPGGCMTAILSNDLFEAVGRADADYLAALPRIVQFIYNRCPSSCHGSREKVNSWLNF